MLKLRYSTTSPFVRKVSITIIESGLSDQVENIATNPWAPDTDLPDNNPLGKVPALVLENGEVLFDSPVICEYLDSHCGSGSLFPSNSDARWLALRQQALGDGIMEAAVGRILESRRPAELQSAAVATRHQFAVQRTLDSLEATVDDLGAEFTIGHITIVSALQYLDFRFSAEDWREGRPNLKSWHDRVTQRPSIEQTVPRD